MTQKPTPTKTLTAALLEHKVEFGSKTHLAALEGAYEMTLAEAKVIMDEWSKDHQSWPFEQYKKAVALTEAAKARPVPVDTSPGWVRDSSE